MGFWDKALGAPAPAPQAQPVYPQQTQPWYVPSPPVPAPQPQPVYQQQPPQPEPPAPSKAMSARSNATCPNCGSGNIFKPNGMANAMEQCYECGWNPRFAHSTAGAGMPSDSSAPARPSRQVSTANNFNPQTIVATVK